jgi:hypothetical protein
MKKTVLFLVAFAILLIAAAPAAEAGRRGRHTRGGIFLSSGSISFGFGNVRHSPFLFARPWDGVAFRVGPIPYRRHFGNVGYSRYGRRHNRYSRWNDGWGYPYDRYRRHRGTGYDRPYWRGRGRQSITGYATQRWVPGRNTPQGYLGGYWSTGPLY